MLKRTPCLVWVRAPDHNVVVVIVAYTSTYRKAKRIQRRIQELRPLDYVGISEAWNHPDLLHVANS